MNSGQISNTVKCIKCGSDLDGFTSVGEEAQPADGDISICFYCASIGKYVDNVTKLEALSETELEKIKQDEPEAYIQLMRISNKIKIRINN